jgi:RNA polymerase sigma factor (sigma-70 family)
MAAQSSTGQPDERATQFADNDAAIIARSLDDPEQFAALFRRHAPRLYRYAARRLGPDLADDVVADTFLHAFRQRARYRGDCPDARPWLYGIATRLIGRNRRAEIRQYRALARTGIDVVADSFAEVVDARVSAAGDYRRLAGALADLPAAYRDALLLVAWGELTYEQAAFTLGVPVGTVRSRLSRARARLRHELGGDQEADASLGASGASTQADQSRLTTRVEL